VKIPSIAGVSHVTAIHSPRQVALLSAPLIRTRRRAGRGAVGVCCQPDGLALLLAQAGPDPEPSLAAAAHQIGQRRPAQPAPWRKQRQRFENIGLSCAVFTNQQVELRGRFQLGRGMIAEVGKGDAIERHGSPAR
jgi:hypothetical protein